ncbi:hypothetical protein PP175_24865 [Aneurinibacillus sp. Ricciae_BoGa-3]|uniref:hypothetical protein n=1 Tax=Aneurinibacillus sp. Ricciae_BoGa-3 TaxID=3022697 RepID=UPI00234028E7|nr:hypothetical protein [Aneurinibacillus sp. Ricciae_BoGa-3]WCK54467.1 hypothetical protein PP175_24865 [Aneurinibacillus sp. Ricciae_BoGa-3]
MLGIVRTILFNSPNEKSKGVAAKNTLVIELLKNSKFHSFLSDIRYYEWTSTKQLAEVSFDDYIQLFLANHHETWMGTDKSN